MQLKTLFRILLTPGCWIRNGPSCKKLSKFINTSLDNGHVPIYQSKFTCILNGIELWTCNYPYAYGSEPFKTPLPDRGTVFRLYDAYDEFDRDK